MPTDPMEEAQKIVDSLMKTYGANLNGLKRKLIPTIAAAIEKARDEQADEDAKIAEKVKFSRICQQHGHEDGEIKWNFNGCYEISEAIKERRKNKDY